VKFQAVAASDSELRLAKQLPYLRGGATANHSETAIQPFVKPPHHTAKPGTNPHPIWPFSELDQRAVEVQK
jgi:hypothetical protein